MNARELTVVDCARQLLGGCNEAAGREILIHGPQVAEVYRVGQEIEPELGLQSEIERIAAGGQLVAVAADDLAEVCEAILEHDFGDGPARTVPSGAPVAANRRQRHTLAELKAAQDAGNGPKPKTAAEKKAEKEAKAAAKKVAAEVDKAFDAPPAAETTDETKTAEDK